MNKAVSIILGMVALSSTLGCSTTVRTMTGRQWITPPGGSSSAPAEKAAGQGAAEGAATPAGAAAPAATTPAGTGIASHYYLTYWEGNCKPVLGCGRGDTHVKRCRVNPDNTVACVEEANATKALNPN